MDNALPLIIKFLWERIFFFLVFLCICEANELFQHFSINWTLLLLYPSFIHFMLLNEIHALCYGFSYYSWILWAHSLFWLKGKRKKLNSYLLLLTCCCHKLSFCLPGLFAAGIFILHVYKLPPEFGKLLVELLRQRRFSYPK